MKLKKYFFFICLFLGLLSVFISCKDNVENIVPIDYEYFPVDTGRWVVYEVEEITIDKPSAVYDTVKYQLKELIHSVFKDNSGRETQRIERYKRTNENGKWILSDVWTSNLTTSSAQKTEENVRYVKIVFPIKLYNSWNGNAYNNLDDENYEITDLDIQEDINGNIFDHVLTVTQKDESYITEKSYRVEKYAKNVGLIYKQIIIVDFGNNYSEDIPFEERIETGTIYNQKIITYGSN